MNSNDPTRRRRLLQLGAAAVGTAALPRWAAAQGAPAVVTSDAVRPVAAQGMQFGDPSEGSVMVWSRSDRAARMQVEWSTDELFRQAQRVVGPYALESTDFSTRLDLTGLPEGREVFVRVAYQGLDSSRAIGEAVTGRFVVPAFRPREHDDGHRRGQVGDIRFQWGGDTAGQGWGINTAFGGMKIYEAMRQRKPGFFIHSGDTIYADGRSRPR